MRYLLAPLLVVLVASGFPSGAIAEWQPNGVAMSAAPGDQYFPNIVTDGSGGAIITWDDDRNGNHDIYAQRVDASGVARWTTHGLAVCSDPSGQYFPTIVSDDAGGAIITWTDDRNGEFGIYAQRVNAAGARQWIFNGVQLCTDATERYDPKIVSDGARGAIVAWNDSRSGKWDCYAQRVDSSGVVRWLHNGVPVRVADHDQQFMRMTSDGAGGAILAWDDSRDSTFVREIYAQRVNSVGLATWTPDGVLLCGVAGEKRFPVIAADGVGGAIVAWEDMRNIVEGYFVSDIYAQRLNAAGVRLWTPNGVPVSAAAGDQKRPAITPDGAGGAIVVWGGPGSSAETDLYAQRVNASGAAQWLTDGVPVYTNPAGPTADHLTLGLVSDGAGGAIVSWEDFGLASTIYAQRVNGSGGLWPWAGAALSTPAIGDYNPKIVSDGAGGAIVTWEDRRNGTLDVWASIANGNTPAGANVVVFPRDATTGSAPVMVTFDNASGGSTSLAIGPSGPVLPGTFALGDGKYYNISTTATFSGNIDVCIQYNESALTVPESSLRLVHYDATVPGWVDITTSLNTGSNQICGVTTSLSPFAIGTFGTAGVGDAPVASGLALHQNSPNPFGSTTVIGFELPKGAAEVRISIFDVSGKRVRTLVDGAFAPGTHHVSWGGRGDLGQHLESGVYYYRIDTGSFRQTRKMVLMK